MFYFFLSFIFFSLHIPPKIFFGSTCVFQKNNLSRFGVSAVTNRETADLPKRNLPHVTFSPDRTLVVKKL
jgi:hypothetical protein